jgi:hypothetical protein
MLGPQDMDQASRGNTEGDDRALDGWIERDAKCRHNGDNALPSGPLLQAGEDVVRGGSHHEKARGMAGGMRGRCGWASPRERIHNGLHVGRAVCAIAA